AGILNSAVNLAASLAVTEAMKVIVGARERVRRTLLSCDLWANEWSQVSAGKPRAGCEVCQKRNFRHLRSEGRPHITLCGRNSVQIHEHGRPVDFAELEERLKPHGKVRSNSMLLRFERGEHILTVFADGRAVIQGTTDVATARTLYARYIGS
ncbi:MAG TPA: hypothetical protein VK670_02035, partial [Silvibacterium sp.]|nr:hypothetical protein [Silvibacterium sp.]